MDTSAYQSRLYNLNSRANCTYNLYLIQSFRSFLSHDFCWWGFINQNDRLVHIFISSSNYMVLNNLEVSFELFSPLLHLKRTNTYTDTFNVYLYRCLCTSVVISGLVSMCIFIMKLTFAYMDNVHVFSSDFIKTLYFILAPFYMLNWSRMEVRTAT